MPKSQAEAEQAAKTIEADPLFKVVKVGMPDRFAIYPDTISVYGNWNEATMTGVILSQIRVARDIGDDDLCNEAWDIVFDKRLPMTQVKKAYAKNGIMITLTADMQLVRWFERLPDVRWEFNCAEMSLINIIGCARLTEELFRQHGGLYVDEVLAVAAVRTILPTPIAAAIINCLRGVMDRRFINLDVWQESTHWNSAEAWQEEVIYTYRDMYDAAAPMPEPPPRRYRLDRYAGQSWEEAATILHYGPQI
jgi:hypothetical protein